MLCNFHVPFLLNVHINIIPHLDELSGPAFIEQMKLLNFSGSHLSPGALFVNIAFLEEIIRKDNSVNQNIPYIRKHMCSFMFIIEVDRYELQIQNVKKQRRIRSHRWISW